MITRVHSILLDAEALSAFAMDRRGMLVWSVLARRTESIMYASTVTLAEVTDDSARDARVRRAAKSVNWVAVSAGMGYQAGKLRASVAGSRRKLRDLTVDAIVAATALALPPPTVVLTSDTGDLELLLDGTSVRVERIS